MDWNDQLFALLDDLEGQAEALYAAERADELADRSRAEYATVTLASRLMASVGEAVVLDVHGPGRVVGVLQRMGADWCLLHGPTQDWVVRLGAVLAVEGASERSVPEVAWSAVAGLGVGSALRRLADSGERCLVHGVDGSSRDVVLTRVGRDFVEAVVGEGRSVLLGLDGVAAVQSRGG
ncbi:hypothetical protein [Nocardioides cynanchi]|uniref:hypothetical protein n=1 Tax=Nocardioides cynanchi TaxID=2558918 RepID=UPI001245CD34|nr:hypothetical protein [Nocardioides cynanchi]